MESTKHHALSIFFLLFSLPPLLTPSPSCPSAREERYSHEFVSDDDDDDGADPSNDTLQQSFANFSHVAPRFSQMIEEMQSSLSDESEPNHQQLQNKMVHILGEGPKHEHRDSGISGEYELMCCTASIMTCAPTEWCMCVCAKDAK